MSAHCGPADRFAAAFDQCFVGRSLCMPAAAPGGLARVIPPANAGVLLLLGSKGVSAMQLFAPPVPEPQEATSGAPVGAAGAAAQESAEAAALRLRALEMLSGDGEW